MRPPPFGDGNLDAACPHIKPIRQVSKGGRTPIRVAKFGDYFGTASLATILGLIGFLAGVMALIGVSVAGWLYDTQGNFTGFLIPAALEAAGRVLFPEGKSAVRNGYCFFTGRPAMTREDGWSYRNTLHRSGRQARRTTLVVYRRTTTVAQIRSWSPRRSFRKAIIKKSM